MSHHNGTEKLTQKRLQKKLQSRVEKPSFFDLCKRYNVNYDDMLGIANKAGVPIQVIQTMFVGKPVKRSDAVAVLKALSSRVPESWTMDNVNVPTLPESEDEQP